MLHAVALLAVALPVQVAALPASPSPALVQWVQSIPAVRCFPTAFSMWTGSKPGVDVPLTRITTKQFFGMHSAPDRRDVTTTVAGGGERDEYGLGRVATTGAAVFDKGGPEEDNYLAVLAGTPAAPRAVPALRGAPRLSGGLGLGSPRAAVEAALGAARAQAACGLDAVHYGPRPQPASEADLWFFYRGGVVVGFVRWEAV